ncbi:MAG: AraC family transcriptional regulator [Sphingobacteriales bacterium]|nr:MAG: AraC family transcriptional regulator [Sphingobacteriales bacterium]
MDQSAGKKKSTVEKVILLLSSGKVAFPPLFLQHFHTHILCERGTMRFLFQDKPYVAKAGEFVFWFADSQVTGIAFSKNFKATVLLVERDFLDGNVPDQSWSIDVVLHSRANPILYLYDKDQAKVLANFSLLHQRYSEPDHLFYKEMLQLQMQLFLFDMWNIFANEYERRRRTVESGSLYEQFMHLVQEHCMEQREVQFYAGQLHITPKYLNYVCRRNTDVTASEWIQRYARERIILLLKNKQLNIAEIADQMNFSSRSFFTRYVKKLLGVTPREFRNRLA